MLCVPMSIHHVFRFVELEIQPIHYYKEHLYEEREIDRNILLFHTCVLLINYFGSESDVQRKSCTGALWSTEWGLSHVSSCNLVKMKWSFCNFIFNNLIKKKEKHKSADNQQFLIYDSLNVACSWQCVACTWVQPYMMNRRCFSAFSKKNAQSSVLCSTHTDFHAHAYTITHHQIPFRPLLGNDGTSNKHVCGEEGCRVIWKVVQLAAGCNLFPAQTDGPPLHVFCFLHPKPHLKTTLWCNTFNGE